MAGVDALLGLRREKMTWEYKIRDHDCIEERMLNAHASDGWRFVGYIAGEYVFERRKPLPFSVQIGLSLIGVVFAIGTFAILFHYFG